MTETGDRAINEFRVENGNRIIVQGKVRQNAGTKVLDQYITLFNKFLDNSAALVSFEIYNEAALVAIDTQIVGALPLCERRTPAARLIALGRFHFDHVRAKIAENHRTLRASEKTAE